LASSYQPILKRYKDMSQSKTFPLGRDSKTGEFIPVKEAQRRPNTTTVERIPKAGNGDTGKGNRNKR
jgi:hypothetical protein